jgi:hypothetical protein
MRKISSKQRRRNVCKVTAGSDWTGEFHTKNDTEFYTVDGIGPVAKKVGDEWITLIPGWTVGEGWGAGPDGDGPITLVEFDPDAAALANSLN